MVQPIVGWASDKFGPRYPATAGFVLGIPLYICLRFVTHNSMQQKVLLCALLALLGLALAFAIAPLLAEISYVVADKEITIARRTGKPAWSGKGAYAQAYGLFNVAFAGGCLVGPIWGGLVVERAGWETMTWTMGLLNAAGAVPVFLWVGGWIGGKKDEKEDSGVAQGGSAEAVQS